MKSVAIADWLEANQRYLTSAVAEVRLMLEHHSGTRTTGDSPVNRSDNEISTLSEIRQGMPVPPALDVLCDSFGLSQFERDIVLLCAGTELDSKIASSCVLASGDPLKNYPTFSLALSALREPHWNALSPEGPLRHWRLIEMAPGGSLTTSQLRIDERILNYLTGVRHIDERLACFVHQVAASENLPESHRSIVRQVISIWRDGQGKRRLPNVQLRGADVTSRSEIAAEVCREMGLGLFSLAANSIPSDPREQLILSRLCEREAILNGDVILVECDDADGSEKAREGSLVQFVERTACLLFVAGRERRMFPRRLTITLDVDPPSTNEQQIMWKERLGPIAAKMNGQIDRLVSQFSLNASMIRTVCDTVLCPPAQDSDDGKYDDTTAALWEACRIIARPQLQNLAQRIEPNIRWDDLVLAVEQKQVLREIALHVKNRLKVYETWGLAAKSPRGLGISALFTGASGTGKTMAAEVLANELKLDLFRIDLSQVVSKYIGETEKNLRSVFDAAESGGAILLFDEADALFGKRSEVKDSHDRYANIEVSYLLQRMENYRGLAILTTNMKEALDQAFLRRIRFVIQFPFPDAAQRAEIWKHVFPDSTPTDGLDAARLAKLSIPGGNIRNVATYAAFLAAESGTPVGMAQVLRAARVEYAKLERPLSDSEIAGWEPRH